MSLELFHIGEHLIAEMLLSLAKHQELHRVGCEISRRTLAQDLQAEAIGEMPSFHPNGAKLRVEDGRCEYQCDPMQTVDILCAGIARAIAFESKLGGKCMTPPKFTANFCEPCTESTHRPPQVSGNMIAVLERKFDKLQLNPERTVVAHAQGKNWTVALPWWLIIRQSVFNQWRNSRSHPVSNNARILIFESLVDLYREKGNFDQLVHQVVGTDFAERWKISPLS